MTVGSNSVANTVAVAVVVVVAMGAVGRVVVVDASQTFYSPTHLAISSYLVSATTYCCYFCTPPDPLPQLFYYYSTPLVVDPAALYMSLFCISYSIVYINSIVLALADAKAVAVLLPLLLICCY